VSAPGKDKQPSRRLLLGSAVSCLTLNALAAPARTSAPAPNTPHKLAFPRDAGAHPQSRTEWWYITGWINAAGQEAAYGFQVTFFRSRVDSTQTLHSRLAARQLLFAHAAVTDVQGKRLWHDQRMARWSGEAPGANPADTASASTQDTGVLLGDWSLVRQGEDLRAQVRAGGFALDVRLQASQSVLLQGDEGLSRKGPGPLETSYYYSLPQLQTSGLLHIQGKPVAVATGSTAWLDHEWSDEILPAGAVGWDWIGINLFDGSALTAFRLRTQSGDALWDGGSFRAGNARFVFHQGEVEFKPLRTWRSPTSRAGYPVEWLVRTPANFYTVKAVIDNQELDSSQSTGAIYWEGLCEVWDSKQRKVGRGYLEMTGYAHPLKM
jgi:predicted secreted hydrolase